MEAEITENLYKLKEYHFPQVNHGEMIKEEIFVFNPF